MNISESDFRQSTYFIESAKFARVGKEWNNNIWDSKNNPMGYHALYYRTDKSECRAVLHMIDGNLEILPDRIYFIPAYSVLHSEIDGEMEKYYVHFQSDFIDFGLLIPSYERCFVPADNMTKGLFDIIVENCKNTDMASERKVQGAMNILLADLLEKMAVKQRDEKKFEKVLKYIQEHYRERIEVGDLAKMMNFSKVYFSNAFKAAFRISPKQYIQGLRLVESQRLLARTELSVREIAEYVGFENENYFSEFFSAKVGISALKFRRSVKG